jgi:hypothetical protein
MATKDRTQRKPVAAPAAETATELPAKVAKPTDVAAQDYIDCRLAQAGAITGVLMRLFGGEYANDGTRPDDDAVFMSLEQAGVLLHECTDSLDGRHDEVAVWFEPVSRAAALIDVIAAMGWSDEWKVAFSDNVMANYLWSVRLAIEKAQASIRAEEAEAAHG